MAESKLAVYGAIVANAGIAVMKFTGAAFTGSSAMLSEGIHSLVDTGDGALLLVGMHMSQRKADEQHPFGHGKELYFWSLIVAVLIFGVGGGVSIYEGILHVLDPAPLEDPFWNYVILGVAAVFEGMSLGIATRQFLKEKGDEPIGEALRTSKDPSVYTVMAEDSAALLGLLAAALGIWGSHALQLPVLDGVASIVIGLLLCAVASLLILQSRKLLVGAAVDTEMAGAIRAIATEEREVVRSAWPLTMYLGPEEVLLALDVEFRPEAEGEAIQQAVNRIERAIRQRYPEVKRIYIEAHRITEALQSRSIAAAAAEAHGSAAPNLSPGRPPTPSPPAR
jgi:cation diffusion facilitator family transporter